MERLRGKKERIPNQDAENYRTPPECKAGRSLCSSAAGLETGIAYLRKNGVSASETPKDNLLGVVCAVMVNAQTAREERN